MTRYWVIAPYESNNLWKGVWKYDLEHEVISIGWRTLGDVSALGEDQLDELIDLTYPTKTPLQKRYLARTFHTFYRSIKVGDIIIARHGRKIMAGVGTVMGTAHYAHQKNVEVLGSEDAHSNYLSVRWHDEPRDKALPGLPFLRSTLSEISEQKFHELTKAQAVNSPPESEHIDQEGESALSADEPTEPEISSSERVDPIPTIGSLLAASRKLVSVPRQTEVRKAIHLMMLNNYSQLPVMHGSHRVDGLFSWRSIGEAVKFHNKECNTVDDCMEKAPEVLKDDTPLLDAIKTIAVKEVVLVANHSNEIVGIVTTSDILDRYDSLAEPFLLLGEIENYLRQLITSSGYSLSALQQAKNPKDTSRKIESVSDLSFGEYKWLLEGSHEWSTRHNNLDRDEFLASVTKVHKIRNDVMHSRPKPVSEAELKELRNTVRFMRSLKLQSTAT